MRNVLIVLAGVVVGVTLRYLLPPFAPESEGRSADAPHTLLSASETRPAINPAYTEPELYVRGYVVLGRRANVFLSDGTTWTEQLQGELRIYRHYVVFRGKTYPIKSGSSTQTSTTTTSPQATISSASVAVTSTLAEKTGADLQGMVHK